MAGKVIMLQGTGSGVGKSVLVTALCRIFLQDGYSVAPFKSQNMALNSFVTQDGGEMGRAQVVQAQACRVEPRVDMNPILIKPTTDVGAQIIVRGVPAGNMSISDYKNYKPQVLPTVIESFEKLRSEFEIIVMEGAGSPAEINLKDEDIVNMKMAEIADAPVILVGDIDRGGVFAWLLGTFDLLTWREKERVKGFLINKFRGDKTLLSSAIDFLEKKTGKKVLGIVPYFNDIKIPEEDSLANYNNKPRKRDSERAIRIAVIRLPRMSNFTDFDSLRDEPDIALHYVEDKQALGESDVIIIPGTKSTISDLEYLYKAGYVDEIISASEQNKIVVGICGGYQMLGQRILDPEHIESARSDIRGLGLLKTVTEFKACKRTFQIKARDLRTGHLVEGYEIHHGETQLQDGAMPIFEIFERSRRPDQVKDGACNPQNTIWGTNIHGLFDNHAFRRHFINQVRARKGWAVLENNGPEFSQDNEYDKLAALVRHNVDLDSIYRILQKSPPYS